MALFGRWLGEEMRRRRILSVVRLAREAGFPAERVGNWVLDRERPSPDETARLAAYLKLPVETVDSAAGITRADRSGQRSA